MRTFRPHLTCLALALGLVACDDGDGGSEAQNAGVGDSCSTVEDCPMREDDAGVALACLPFKGGYCGATGCAGDVDCPAGSACVTHEGANYCFLVCADKPQCNARRPADAEANCSANLDFTDDRQGRKVCVPPSSGS